MVLYLIPGQRTVGSGRRGACGLGDVLSVEAGILPGIHRQLDVLARLEAVLCKGLSASLGAYHDGACCARPYVVFDSIV